MRIIGLTGGIACGKSSVSNLLRTRGAVIVDGDVLSRELTAEGGIALPAIRAVFGDTVFQGDTLDRRALGARVFSDPSARARLDGIMQPLLLTLIRRDIDRAAASGAAACVLDMPLLYEKGLDSLCDTVWCVTVPLPLQVERLMRRDGFTHEQAIDRINSQMPTAEKAARSDVVIDTSGTIEETALKIPDLYAAELAAEGRAQ